MKRKWISISLGLWVIVSAVGCSAGAAPLTDRAGSTSQPGAPRDETRAWTVVPIPQSPLDSNSTPIPTPLNPTVQSLVAQAKEDLARRLAVPVEQIDLIELQSVVWPDKGLGCPQPGMIYTQVQVDGLLIRFRAGGRIYEYHSGEGRPAFLCKEPVRGKPGDKNMAPPPGFVN